MLLLVAVTFSLIVSVASSASTDTVLLDPNSRPAKDGAECSVSASTNVTINPSTSSRVVATSSQRAWARISIGNNATNTAFLSFDEDASAVANQGLGLNLANTNGASSTPSIDFGLATTFPYTGSVTAISNLGTTSLLVTTCDY